MIRVATLLLAAVACVSAQELSGPVVRVNDGDTIEVMLAGEVERVRYIGIDTPEMNDPRPAVRELAAEARRANARLVGGRTVRLELDVETRDRHGRLLAYVYVGDTLVNEALVRSGHAVPFTVPPNVRHVERFVEAAAAAAEAERDAELEADARPEEPDAAGPLDTIPAHAAAEHVGQTKTVCGRVATTRYLPQGRRPTFLNLGQPYPDQHMTVVIWGEDRSRFGAPEITYRGERICVTGRIETYRGTPQIIVRQPEALRIAP